MFWYIPLPRYAERYTEYLSCVDGMFETALKEYKIPFRAIRPSNDIHRIKTGVVLDPEVMCRWGFAQTYTMVKNITDGLVVEGDIIFFEDFWHPGMEMIPYTLSLMGLYKKVKLVAYNHAQSVDKNDFTFKKMMPWIRGFETAWVDALDYVFCGTQQLADLMLDWGWGMGRADKYVAVGMMFDSAYLQRVYNPMQGFTSDAVRQKIVVYSSRVDEEKDPQFLIEVIKETYKLDPEIMFAICTSAEELRGHKESVDWLNYAANTVHWECKASVDVLTDLSKKEYYEALCGSAVQFNCAKQDFIAYTLLEATTFGCVPYYPDNNDSFVDALGNSIELLYHKEAGAQATALGLVALVNAHAGKYIDNHSLRFVYKKYDYSIARMFQHLGLIEENTVLSLEHELANSLNVAQIYDMAHDNG